MRPLEHDFDGNPSAEAPCMNKARGALGDVLTETMLRTDETTVFSLFRVSSISEKIME